MVKSVFISITFNGDCSEALEFYANVFGAVIKEKTTYAEAKLAEKEEHNDLIMNSTFLLGGNTFICYDSLIDIEKNENNISIWLEIENSKSLLKIYKELKDNNGKIISEPEDTFWNSKYAKINDKYGVTWELNSQN